MRDVRARGESLQVAESVTIGEASASAGLVSAVVIFYQIATVQSCFRSTGAKISCLYGQSWGMPRARIARRRTRIGLAALCGARCGSTSSHATAASTSELTAASLPFRQACRAWTASRRVQPRIARFSSLATTCS